MSKKHNDAIDHKRKVVPVEDYSATKPPGYGMPDDMGTNRDGPTLEDKQREVNASVSERIRRGY